MIIHDVDQNTPEWEAMRCSMPTASNASKLITSTGSPSKSMAGYAKELAQNLFAGKPVNQWEGNKYTAKGHEVEPQSIDAYEFKTDIETTIVGFCTDDHQRYGASPDRLVGDNGMVEAKCLPKLHVDALLYYKKHGKCPTDRIAQTQMQMLVCEREWNDVVYYHPDLPMLVIRQYPDEKIQKALKIQIAECINERDRIVELLRSY